jgi:dihydropteroate synthase
VSNFVFSDIVANHKPSLMGVLNITPDSFSDGGLMSNGVIIHKHINDLWKIGVNIIDIGAESTKPNATQINSVAEINRLSVLNLPFKKSKNQYYSIDTYKAKTAEFALDNGFDIVNDVTGLKHDKQMAKMIASYDAGVIIMYNHALNTHKTGNIVNDCMNGLKESLDIADIYNINLSKICLDIGIGFGTTPQENLMLLNNISHIQTLGFPILVGASRKSFIHHFLDIPDPVKRLGATLATHYHAVQNGADIIRIHDVFDHKQFFDMMSLLKPSPPEVIHA